MLFTEFPCRQVRADSNEHFKYVGFGIGLGHYCIGLGHYRTFSPKSPSPGGPLGPGIP